MSEVEDIGHAIGINMNTGSVTTSGGEVIPGLGSAGCRHARGAIAGSLGQLEMTSVPPAKTALQIATGWHNWHHRTSPMVANAPGNVVVEDLQAARLTGRERGTAAELVRDVSVKAWLNWEILATSRGKPAPEPEYRAHRVVAVPCTFTSQSCATCRATGARSRMILDRVH